MDCKESITNEAGVTSRKGEGAGNAGDPGRAEPWATGSSSRRGAAWRAVGIRSLTHLFLFPLSYELLPQEQRELLFPEHKASSGLATPYPGISVSR